MNETLVTLQGWLGGDVTLRPAGDAMVAGFRVGCTPRRYSRTRQEWINAETQWYSVSAWRGLGDNCARSLRRGDPVVVHGRMSAKQWVDGNGVDRVTLEVEADLVGHDLNRGQSLFTKTPRPMPVAAPEDAGRVEVASEEEATTTAA